MLRAVLAAFASLLALAVIAPVVLLGLPFWLVAGLARLAHDRLVALKREAAPWRKLVRYAPGLGWRPQANLSAIAYGDKPFRVTTDGDGWRGRTTVQESDVVVFGDSYAFGYGVGDRAHFAALAERTKIKCIGVNGYNMVQELLLMQELAPQLANKLVVWFIYQGNDLYDNLQPNLGRYRMPFLRKARDGGQWEIVTSHVRPEPWHGDVEPDYYAALARICTPTHALSRHALDACEHLLREGRRVCCGAAARLLVMSIPDITQISDAHLHRLAAAAPDPAYFDPLLPDARLEGICRRLGLPFVALRRHLDVADHKLYDAHWNERGHRRVAALIEALHERDRAPAHGRREPADAASPAPSSV